MANLMTVTALAAPSAPDLLDDSQLPDSDGQMVENLHELPQVELLNSTLWPVLERLHPDGCFCVGGNSGIYWRPTQPPLAGCKGPDWFYIPGVPQRHANGRARRSYVMWKEKVAPLIVLEFVSGDGSEERDRTPQTGKFWVYERGIKAGYYGIFDAWRSPAQLEVYRRQRGRYQALKANAQGHYAIPELTVALGMWTGAFKNETGVWLRWWDQHGHLLPSGAEREAAAQRQAEQARQQAEQARRQAEQERADKLRLAERLRSLGINPDEI